MRSESILPILSIAVLSIAFPAFAQVPATDLDEKGTVYEADNVEQAAAESILASAESVIYFPGLQRARWFEADGGSTSALGMGTVASAVTRSRQDFRDDLDRDFPGFRSSVYGPYLLKLPARAQAIQPASSVRDFPISPTATLLSDSFETGLSQWQLANNSNGDYNFNIMGCKAHTGGWSADAVRGGNKGQYLFCSDGYPAGITTEMKHNTCEGILGADQAWLDFYLTADMDNSETFGVYYLASDGYIWGYEFSGSWSGWTHIILNLKQWYHIGDLSIASCPKVVFQFRSDATATAGAGPQIDDVTIRTDAPPFLRCSIAAAPVSGAAPLSVSFTPSVSGASGSETYLWSFGDAGASTSSSRNANFTYTAAGDYWARLRVAEGNITRGYAHVKIQVTPAAACSVACTASVPTSAIPGISASFQATATPAGCSGSPTYSWSFGDGQTSAQQNPSHAYAAAGTYSWMLTVTAGSANCAKSGTITVAASGDKLRRRAISPPAGTFNGTDVVVSPSSSPQTVRYGDASVTIPGGMLAAAQHVKVSVAQGVPPANFALLKQLGAYNIEIGTMHSLPAEVTVRMKYDPAVVRSDIPASRALSASYWSSEQSVWVTIPSEIDSTTNEIVVKTRHLSLFSWSMVKLGYDVFFKNHFYIVYNKAEVTDPNFLRWYRNPDTSNYADINVPNYVEDVMAFLIGAYSKYVDETKFTAPSSPIDVYVGTDLSSFSDKFTGIILISLLPQTPEQLKFVTAHELFHRVQNAYYYDLGGMLWLKWWLEATADYAGDQVAWGGLGLMGSKISHSYLEAPLTDSGAAHDEGYSTSHFVKYLVDQGANYKAMWDATANPDWFDSFSFLDGISTYLQRTFGLNNGLNRQYQKFARYFIFDANSPMPAITDSMHSEVAAYRSTITGTGDTAAFNLKGGYTAKLWGVRFDDALFGVAAPKLKYTVATVGALPTRVEADVYVLKGDTRVAGGGVPAGTLAQGTGSTQVEVEKGDAVYVLAVNADGSDRQVSVSITNDATTPPGPGSWSKVEVSFQLPVKDSGGSDCPWIYAPMLERKSLVTPKCTATGAVTGTINISCNDGEGVTMKASIDGTLAQYFGPPNWDPPHYYFGAAGQQVATYAKSLAVTIDYGNRVCTWPMGTDFAGADAANSPAYLKVNLWP